MVEKGAMRNIPFKGDWAERDCHVPFRRCKVLVAQGFPGFQNCFAGLNALRKGTSHVLLRLSAEMARLECFY